MRQLRSQDGRASEEHNTAVAALAMAHPSIGKALRRPGLIAGAEAVAPCTAAAVAITVMHMAASGLCKAVALRDVLPDLQPVAPQCLRSGH